MNIFSFVVVNAVLGSAIVLWIVSFLTAAVMADRLPTAVATVETVQASWPDRLAA